TPISTLSLHDALPISLHLRYGPVPLQPAELKSAVRRVKAPQLPGFVTQIHAYVVDGRGRRLASDRVMLHHAVFRRLIPPRYDRRSEEHTSELQSLAYL